MVQFHAAERVRLFRKEITGMRIGERIRCTGLDADDLCSAMRLRDRHGCEGCGAISELIRLGEPVVFEGRGIIRIERL